MHNEESFIHILLDLNHWGIELVAEVFFFAIEVFILDRLLHRHGR